MKLLKTVMFSCLAITLCSAFTAYAWSPGDCEDGSDGVLTVNLINNSHQAVIFENVHCDRCSTNSMGSKIIMGAVTSPNHKATFKACGVHEGSQNNVSFIMTAIPAPGKQVIAESGYLNFDNVARGTLGVFTVYPAGATILQPLPYFNAIANLTIVDKPKS
jgi:hypothetical protein